MKRIVLIAALCGFTACDHTEADLQKAAATCAASGMATNDQGYQACVQQVFAAKQDQRARVSQAMRSAGAQMQNSSRMTTTNCTPTFGGGMNCTSY